MKKLFQRWVLMMSKLDFMCKRCQSAPLMIGCIDCIEGVRGNSKVSERALKDVRFLFHSYKWKVEFTSDETAAISGATSSHGLVWPGANAG